ncbi:MAG: hypothetical protein AB8B84_16765 [Granulosicoccus sp.]
MTNQQCNTNIKLGINRIIAITLTLFALCNVSSKTFAAESKLAQHVLEQFGPPPSVPSGELNQELKNAVKTVFTESLADSGWTQDQSLALNVIANSEDPRLAWWIGDLMRFAGGGGLSDVLGSAASKLLGIKFPERRYWDRTTDHLMAWNIPAPPNYLDVKGEIFNALVPGWENIFTKGDIDWRHVSWGGVLIDNRAYDTTDESCNCIPAAENPLVTDAKSATWLHDEDVQLIVDAGGLRAVDSNGIDLGSHQAFWFAWSQFYNTTKLWPSKN